MVVVFGLASCHGVNGMAMSRADVSPIIQVIFPSFVPHCVLPLGLQSGRSVPSPVARQLFVYMRTEMCIFL